MNVTSKLDLDGMLNDWPAPALDEAAWETRAARIVEVALSQRSAARRSEDTAAQTALLAAPDLAACETLHDLPAVTRVPLLGALPERAGALESDAFACVARHGLGPALRGRWQTPGP